MSKLIVIPVAVLLLFVIRTQSEAAPANPPHRLIRAFHCLYRYESAGLGWDVNTGNGYYGGLQMDRDFARTWGREFYQQWGTPDHWPKEVQIAVGIRAYFKRGWNPWPTTSRLCGLR